ncbi:hypothetical protein [Leifsonia xyli]|uniref:hypothetical protein n=1 Tax=Leifsonia xyli TaxID=1575 RepID=UPI00114CDC54|nr:hypothetical protein [Leifsonia xyli]
MSTIALIIVATLFAFRAPSMVHSTRGRPAWLASGYAITGLLTLGFVVPLNAIDALLAGDNNWALAEAISATCAF